MVAIHNFGSVYSLKVRKVAKKSDYSLFINFIFKSLKIGLFINFKTLITHYSLFFGSLFTIHYKKGPLLTNHYTPPLIHSRRVVVSYKRKFVHKLLVNRLFKPAQEKVWLGELTVPQ